MLLTLTLAAGLLAAPQPQAQPPKGNGWFILDGRGDGVLKDQEYPKKAQLPKGWIILDGSGDGELKVHEYPKKAQPPKGWIIEFQWRETKVQITPLEVQYSDDLSAFFKQFKSQNTSMR
jgi:hypothetical protein